MTYTIRPVEARDNLRIKEIVRFCLDEYHAPHEGSAWSDPDLDRFSEVYAPKDSGYWVAEDENGRVVGGAGIGRHGFVRTEEHLGEVGHYLCDVLYIRDL